MNLSSILKRVLLKKKKEIDMHEKIEIYRKNGINIGENVHIYSNLGGVDACLLSIGNNTTVSGDVKFLMHDSAIIM